MAASEAVMVAPEQCGTAPKTLAAKHAAPAKTSTTRLVLLAVLALAAATGAMFGVVVLGNQLTQELHPKGSSHLNSVTLVDSEDRAIATTAVESYVSLLDLPLLGTAELNKVDGITFSTYRGIEHRKVTGYTVTTETARVGDSEAQTPRLSLATSAPGETVEVSVRDNKAWLSQVEGGSAQTTAIDTTSQRRLADGGSCLESGACLYSRDELLRLDAASRRLEEGSFFARADVAAYQVELSGDLMQYLEGAAAEATLDGTYTEGGHTFRLRLEQAAAGTRVLFTNHTSGESKLITSKGTFVFSASGRLVRCNGANGMSDVDDLSVDDVAKMFDFDAVDVAHGATEGVIPFDASVRECLDLTAKQANMSTPEALERFPELAGGVQGIDLEAAKENYFGLESRRKLAADDFAAVKAHIETKELLDIMTNPASGRAMTMEELSHPDHERVLKAARAKAHADRELKTTITMFDLWVATRMANPEVKKKGYMHGLDPTSDQFFVDATAGGLGAQLSMDLSGWMGISTAFAEWSGFHYYAEVTNRRQLKGCSPGMPGCNEGGGGMGGDGNLNMEDFFKKYFEVAKKFGKNEFEPFVDALEKAFSVDIKKGENELKNNKDLAEYISAAEKVGQSYRNAYDKRGADGVQALAEDHAAGNAAAAEKDLEAWIAKMEKQDWDSIVSELERDLGMELEKMRKTDYSKDIKNAGDIVDRFLSCVPSEWVMAFDGAFATAEKLFSGAPPVAPEGPSGKDMAYFAFKMVHKASMNLETRQSAAVSQQLYAGSNSGVCTGGYNDKSKPMKSEKQAALCQHYDAPSWSVDANLLAAIKADGGCECADMFEAFDNCAVPPGMTPEEQLQFCRADAKSQFEECMGGAGGKMGEEDLGKEMEGALQKGGEAMGMGGVGMFDEEVPERMKEREGDKMGKGPCAAVNFKLSTMPCEERMHLNEGHCMPFLFKYAHASTNPDLGVQNTCNGAAAGGKRRLSGGGALEAAAFASILYKHKGAGTEKYVISFQGTSFDEPAMMEYSTAKDPVTFDYAGSTVVTTHGFAMYVAQLFPCISKLGANVQAQYVTGHSLGGAAATLYKATAGGGALVTFGAPPTVMASYDGSKVKGAVDVNNNAYKPLKEGGPKRDPTPTATGMRYFHKFDPVPAFYFNGGQWAHGVSSAKIMFDQDGYGRCGGSRFAVDESYVKADYDPRFSGPMHVANLQTHLCTQHGVQVNTGRASAGDYSYTNAWIAAPCAEGYGAAAVDYLSGMGYDTSKVPSWTPNDNAEACQAHYVATVEAYVETYLTSQLVDSMTMGKVKDKNPTFLLMFYSMWGMWWVHSSYPNYPM